MHVILLCEIGAECDRVPAVSHYSRDKSLKAIKASGSRGNACPRSGERQRGRFTDPR
jgi:hypothetical protein